MKNLFLAFLAMLFSMPVVFSQLTFQKLEGIGGKPNISYLLGDQNANLYAVTEADYTGINGTVYRSQNAGLSWQKLSFNGKQVYIAPDGTLFGSKLFYLYRSTDHGDTWAKLQHQPPGGSLSVITANGVLISGIMRSTDNGDTWTEGPVSNSGKMLAGNDGYLYGFAGTFISRSNDDGLSWQMAGTYPNLDFSGTVFFQTQSGRLMVLRNPTQGFLYSDDHGYSWTNYSPNMSSNEYLVSIVQTSTSRLGLLTNTSRYYSDDDGTTWTKVGHESYEEPVKGLYQTPDGNIWANYQGALYRTSDATLQNWTFTADGMEEPTILDIEIRSDNSIYVATTGGLYHSNNAGNTWTHFYQEPINRELYTSYYRLHFCFDQNDNIVLCDGVKVWRINPQTGSRTDITPAGNPGVVYPYTAFNLPQGDLLISDNGGTPYISHDNGNTWSIFNLPYQSVTTSIGMITDVKVAADSVVYLHSFDGYGLQYNPLNQHIKIAPWSVSYSTYAFDLGPSGEIHVGFDKYCSSVDFAQTWECHNILGIIITDLVVNAAGYVFYSDLEYGNGIYESVDDGQSWNHVFGSATTRGRCLRLAPSGRLYFSVPNQGLFCTTTSTSTQPILKGSVFNDELTADCDRETAEQKVVQVKTRLEGAGNTYIGISNQYGQYTMPALTGDVQAEAIPPSNYWEACQKNLTVAANATGVVTDSLALGLQPLVSCPKMEVSLSAPYLTRCFDSYLIVDYCNTGTLAALGATVEVTLDPFLLFKSADAPIISQNGQKFTFQIGDVDVNHCGQFKILVTVSCDASLGQEHCSSAHIYPDQDCMSNWTGSWLETSAHCTANGLVLDIHNRGAAMSAATTYSANYFDETEALVAQTGNVQLSADETFSLTMPANVFKVFFSAQQESGFPYGSFAGLQVQNCGLGDSTFAVEHYADHYTWEDEECVANVGSFDPNDKSATPPGFGAANYLPRDQGIEYQIRFQNTGTAKATTVVVRDSISPWLDLSTVRPIASSHPFLFEIKGQELVFRFPNINLPDSSSNESASHGFLRFTIQPRVGLPDGTALDNQARIYFDYNDPVITNTTHYTFGMPTLVNTQSPDALAILQVSPNPSSGQFIVELPNWLKNTNDNQLCLTDMTGREIFCQAINDHSTGFNLPDLASGLYLLSVRAHDGRVQAIGKWVKN